MFTLPPTPIRLHPTLGHVRVQVCRTGISFEERFANPIHKRCKIVSCVTVGKIRTIQSKTWVIADPERSKSGLRQKSTLGQRDASSRFVLRDFQLYIPMSQSPYISGVCPIGHLLVSHAYFRADPSGSRALLATVGSIRGGLSLSTGQDDGLPIQAGDQWSEPGFGGVAARDARMPRHVP